MQIYIIISVHPNFLCRSIMFSELVELKVLKLFDLIEGDDTVFEKGPLTKLVEQKELVGYVHKGFWQCMDTLREKQKLESLWESGKAPWKVWED